MFPVTKSAKKQEPAFINEIEPANGGEDDPSVSRHLLALAALGATKELSKVLTGCNDEYRRILRP